MIPFNFRIEILSIRALLCALGSKGLNITLKKLHSGPYALDPFIVHKIFNFHNL